MLYIKGVGFTKPDVRFFNAIAGKIGFTPDQIVMIGNDYEKDIKPAKIAGFHTIYYSEIMDQVCNEYADYITNDIGQLIRIVPQIA